MKKRTKIRIICFSCAVCISVGGFYIRLSAQNRKYRQRIFDYHNEAVNSLSDSVGNISAELKRLRYITSPEKLSVCAAKIYREAGEAASALSHIPADGDLSAVYKFLSQAGDYSISVLKKYISDGEIDAESRENLSALSKTADTVASSVEEMRKAVCMGESANLSADIEVRGCAESLNEGFEDYPTLIYDGPYSDHILTGESEMLLKSDPITLAEAKKKAAEVMALSERELTLSGEQGGRLPAYRFSAGNSAVAVTKNGGYTLYFRKYRETGKQILTCEQAVRRAKTWLCEHSGLSFEESYYIADEGICTVNFAYKEGTTICYTDLIKVGVALDDGEIMLCEADGFVMNHKKRSVTTPIYTQEEARERVSGALTVNVVLRVLIPSDGKTEIPCYEFACTDKDGQEVLVYINQDTLSEERILLLMKTEGGSFVK